MLDPVVLTIQAPGEEPILVPAEELIRDRVEELSQGLEAEPILDPVVLVMLDLAVGLIVDQQELVITQIITVETVILILGLA